MNIFLLINGIMGIVVMFWFIYGIFKEAQNKLPGNLWKNKIGAVYKIIDRSTKPAAVDPKPITIYDINTQVSHRVSQDNKCFYKHITKETHPEYFL